ncbi:MAG: class II aldolase/adducin family protein [Chloroflexota bacterium]
MELSLVLQFKSVGEDLCQNRLVSAHGGNLSVRIGDRLVITRHACALGRLAEADLVEASLDPRGLADALASMEVAVHRAIYCLTDAGAIVHAHPAHAIALSLKARKIVPADVEGSVLLGRVLVVGWGRRLRPGGGAEVVARALRKSRVVMVHGHGCFAVGKNLEEACGYVTTLEESCRILYLLKDLAP